MSIEAMMEKLAAALDRNTAALTGGKAETKPAATAAEEKPAGKPGRPPKADKPKGPTMEQVAEKATALKDKSGMPAVREVMKEHGSATGKIGDLPTENYGAVIAAIDGLLSDDQPAAEDDESL